MKPCFKLASYGAKWLVRRHFRNVPEMRYEGNIVSDRPVAYLFNHTSNFDPLLVRAYILGDYYLISHDNFFKNWFVSFFLNLVGMVSATKKGGRELLKLISEGRSLALAPEGRRNFDGYIGEFENVNGLLYRLLIARASYQIVPVVIHYSERSNDYPTLRGNLLIFMDERYPTPSCRMQVVVGAPIDTTEYRLMNKEDAKSRFPQHLRKEMQRILKGIEESLFEDRMLIHPK